MINLLVDSKEEVISLVYGKKKLIFQIKDIKNVYKLKV
jgi:hypothetical protein